MLTRSSIAALAVVVMSGARVAAQTPPDPLRTTLPPITVTAQKEPEDPQNLPLSVTAVLQNTLNADALRSVITLAKTDKKVKALSPSLAKLKKLDDEGLLEAYILLAKADDGISSDHPQYLKASRDKLRRYMLEYVVAGGGN